MPTVTVPRQKWPKNVRNQGTELLDAINWTASVNNNVFDLGFEPAFRQHTIVGFHKTGPGNTSIDVVAYPGNELIPQTTRDLSYKDDPTSKFRLRSSGFLETDDDSFDLPGGSLPSFFIPNTCHRYNDSSVSDPLGRFYEAHITNVSSLFWCCLILPMRVAQYQNPVYEDVLYKKV